MMKKILFLAALLLAAMPVLAGNVDLSTAQSKATDFLRTKAFKSRLMTSAPTIKWTHEVKNSSNAALAAYYIVNTDKGYVIVSGDDRAKDILAFGEGSLNGLNDLPEAVQYFLNIYQKQMEYLQAHPGMFVAKRSATRGVSVEPMLQTAWAQDKPYNKQCPKVGNTYCKVGCTAVALAQVMRYWEYPTTSPALPAYICEDSHINVPALGEYTFDWNNMWDTYYDVDLDRLPQVNEDAIAYLMRYVGQAEKVDYNTNQTGTRNPEILTAIQTFGFDEDARIVKKCDSPDTPEELAAHDYTEEEYYNDAEWAEAIQAELRAGRPLIYCAYDMSSDSTSLGGHAFNVDGYDAENDMYHVNFGMNPSLNTYYALNAFSTDGWLVVYDFWPIFFAGVQPPGMATNPRILVSPQELSMECYTGETTTATFNVVGENLSEGIIVALNDANGVFTTNVATITVENGAANTTVTVTYAPQAVGNHAATITLSSEGAENKVVTLSGTATNAPLEVYTPVMQPADSNYIRLTSFRADWTDQTIDENVTSYTLEVSTKPEGPAAGDLIAEADWSTVPQSGSVPNVDVNAANYLPEGWGYDLTALYLDGGCISMPTDDYIITNTLDLTGFNKVTVVVVGKDFNPNFKHSGVMITTSAGNEYVGFDVSFVTRTVVLDCSESEQIKFTADYYPEIQSIRIYAGEITAPQLRATETGNETYRLITGITDKFYTVENLAEAGTYLYKVKAIYKDGTQSEWSNIEEVTLFDNGPAPHGYQPGDVNHDGDVTIKDVTALIDYLLGTNNDICTTCADVSGDNEVTIKDVTNLIDMLLGGGN